MNLATCQQHFVVLQSLFASFQERLHETKTIFRNIIQQMKSRLPMFILQFKMFSDSEDTTSRHAVISDVVQSKQYEIINFFSI